MITTNTADIIVNEDPNTIAEIQGNQLQRVARYDDSSKIWDFVAENPAGSKWVLRTPFLDRVTATLFIYVGQSNAGGRENFPALSSFEMQPQEHIEIWNAKKQVFEPLNLPDMNFDPDENNETVTGSYGSEVAFILGHPELYGNKKMYICKHSQGNTNIEFWSEGGEGKERFDIGYGRAAIRALEQRGEVVGVVLLYHQGEADNSVIRGGATHLARLETLVDDWRNDYSTYMPIVLGEIESGTNDINANFATVANDLNFIGVAAMEGETTIDGIHFDDRALRLLGQRQLEANPLRYGAPVRNSVSTLENYYIRTVSNSLIDDATGTATLLIDLEQLNNDIGITELEIDGVAFPYTVVDRIFQPSYVINTATNLENSHVSLVNVENYPMDGLSHVLTFRNNLTGFEQSFNFEVNAAADFRDVGYDFSAVAVPSVDADLINWSGEHSVDVSPSTENGVHWTTDVGGINPVVGERLSALAKGTSNTRSFVLELDYLRETNSGGTVTNLIYFNANYDGNKPIGYRLLLRNNAIILQNIRVSGAEIIRANSPIPTVPNNTWRSFRITKTGYNVLFEYSDDNKVTWIELFEYEFRETNFTINGYFEDTEEYHDTGDILIGGEGNDVSQGWFRDILLNI